MPWLPVSPNQDRPAAIPAALARYIGTVTQGMSMQAARRYRITPELENLERHGQASTTRLLQVLHRDGVPVALYGGGVAELDAARTPETGMRR